LCYNWEFSSSSCYVVHCPRYSSKNPMFCRSTCLDHLTVINDFHSTTAEVKCCWGAGDLCSVLMLLWSGMLRMIRWGGLGIGLPFASDYKESGVYSGLWNKLFVNRENCSYVCCCMCYYAQLYYAIWHQIFLIISPLTFLTVIQMLSTGWKGA